MILDNELLSEDLAHDGTDPIFDLGNADVGPGNPVKLFIQGSSDLAGCTGFNINDGATSSPADSHLTYVGDPAGRIIEIELPSDTQRYITVVLTGTTSAGTWTCGVVLPGVQTAA